MADQASPGRVLVVDDVARNLRLLEAVLAPAGYELITANSGQEALDRIADGSPDLVLLDVRMPGMDGYEVCRRVRADPASALLPIVLVTSAEGEERVAGLQAGADDFVKKPFEAPELAARIKAHIKRVATLRAANAA